MTSDLSAALAEIRARARVADTMGFHQLGGIDVPALAVALEAVLALAHRGPIYVRDDPVYDWTLDPAVIREVIETALRDTQGGAGQ